MKSIKVLSKDWIQFSSDESTVSNVGPRTTNCDISFANNRYHAVFSTNNNRDNWHLSWQVLQCFDTCVDSSQHRHS